MRAMTTAAPMIDMNEEVTHEAGLFLIDAVKCKRPVLCCLVCVVLERTGELLRGHRSSLRDAHIYAILPNKFASDGVGHWPAA